MLKEEWRTIPGYNNRYSVSNHGRIYNNERERYLKGYTSKEGNSPYPRVSLTKDRKRYDNNIHRLVGEAFLPNENNLETINHKDENKENNHVDNLEWLSMKDNANHGKRNEKISNGQKSIKRVGTSLDGKHVIRLESSHHGKELGFSQQGISDCCTGRQKTHKGYTWKNEGGR